MKPKGIISGANNTLFSKWEKAVSKQKETAFSYTIIACEVMMVKTIVL